MMFIPWFKGEIINYIRVFDYVLDKEEDEDIEGEDEEDKQQER